MSSTKTRAWAGAGTIAALFGLAGCCSRRPAPADPLLTIAVCQAPLAWPAAPGRVASLAEHLERAPRWEHLGVIGAVDDVLLQGKPGKLARSSELAPLFEASSAPLEASESATVLCRIKASPHSWYTATVGGAVLKGSLFEQADPVVSLPGAPLDPGAAVALETTTYVGGACKKGRALAVVPVWECDGRKVESGPTTRKVQGPLPASVSTPGGDTLECRGVASAALQPAIEPKLRKLENAHADECRRLARPSEERGDGRSLREAVIDLAAFVGWADPRVAAAVAHHDALYAGWAAAQRALASAPGQAARLPPGFPAIKVAGPLRCDAEAEKRSSLVRVAAEREPIACRLELVASTPAAARARAASSGLVEEHDAWDIKLDLVLATGEMVEVRNGVFAGPAGAAVELEGPGAAGSWVVDIPREQLEQLGQGAVVRVKASRTEPGSLFASSALGFLALPPGR